MFVFDLFVCCDIFLFVSMVIAKYMIFRYKYLHSTVINIHTFSPIAWWAANVTAIEPSKAVISANRAYFVAFSPKPPNHKINTKGHVKLTSMGKNGLLDMVGPHPLPLYF